MFFLFLSQLCFKIHPLVMFSSNFCIALNRIHLIHFMSTNEYPISHSLRCIASSLFPYRLFCKDLFGMYTQKLVLRAHLLLLRSVTFLFRKVVPPTVPPVVPPGSCISTLHVVLFNFSALANADRYDVKT